MSSPRFSSSHNIQFYGDHIFTTVTPSAAIVDEWIANTRRIYRRKLSKLLVGLDTEWCLPAQPGGYQKVAIIQLCVGKRCLIFQLYHADYIPQSLIRFLGNKKFTFVGKEVQNDADKLFQDYKLHVAHTKDVGYWAAKKYDYSEYRGMGLKALVSDLLQKVIPKPRRITLSRWNAKNLRVEQIEYACLDAFVSFELDYIPQSLIRFLGNKKFTFVGKEVQNDADKLFQDYKLHVAHTKDVSYWAAKKYDDSEYRRMGLKALVSDLLQKVIPKPRQITLSRWNAKNLRVEQIEYACLDAFVSFELGLLLSKPIQEITHSPEVVHLTPETVAQLDELFGRVGRRCEEIEPVRQLEMKAVKEAIRGSDRISIGNAHKDLGLSEKVDGIRNGPDLLERNRTV
ncbi:hypothetical protein GH714_013947 [Hevea brasiliensis]|uniref:3'-5' exonuclease domain-containing protein n=1 Tax=Hevea brasiliensis TaxID=3981 RepID=A0A6A6LIZ5_HEVBR|nr:hypothetical protein GH714_013947 [Hevea brasiliensis]